MIMAQQKNTRAPPTESQIASTGHPEKKLTYCNFIELRDDL